MRKVSLALAAALSIGAATQAFATPDTIFFDINPVSTSGELTTDPINDSNYPAVTSPTSITMSNPSITLNVGQTATLNIWVNVATTNDIINSLGLDINTSNAGVVHATSDYIPYVVSGITGNARWDTTSQAALNGSLTAQGGTTIVSNLRPFSTGSDGLHSTTDALKVATNNLYLGSVTILADQVGTTNLKFAVGNLGIGYKSGADAASDLITFGSGGGTVLGSNIGAQSTVADAVITVTGTPEPASLTLLGLGGLLLVRRRSSRKA
jgi:MYXO-CTERM domain-containing protein